MLAVHRQVSDLIPAPHDEMAAATRFERASLLLQPALELLARHDSFTIQHICLSLNICVVRHLPETQGHPSGPGSLPYVRPARPKGGLTREPGRRAGVTKAPRGEGSRGRSKIPPAGTNASCRVLNEVLRRVWSVRDVSYGNAAWYPSTRKIAMRTTHPTSPTSTLAISNRKAVLRLRVSHPT